MGDDMKEMINPLMEKPKKEGDAFKRMEESLDKLGFEAEQLPNGWTMIQPKGLLFPDSVKELKDDA
ncbi:MAG: hypothetical protein ABW176_13060 [Candidatus Thiodiazotropha endolucinida]